MNAHPPTTALREGVFERAEAMLGRADWAWADYIAEGRRAYLATGGRGDASWHAWHFAYFNCPPSKRPRTAA